MCIVPCLLAVVLNLCIFSLQADLGMSALQAKKVANRVQEQAAGAAGAVRAGGAGDAGGAGELASLKKVTRGWREVLDEPAPAGGGAEGRGAPAEALSEKEAKKLRKEVDLPPAFAKWLRALLQSGCERFCQVAASAFAKWLRALLQSGCERFCQVAASAFAAPASCSCDCCR